MSKARDKKLVAEEANADDHHGKHAHGTEHDTDESGSADSSASKREANDPNSAGKHAAKAAEPHNHDLEGGASDGKHRMMEGREQHDQGDKNSDKNRLIKDIQRHGHDKEQFQVPGGAENHPKSGESKH